MICNKLVHFANVFFGVSTGGVHIDQTPGLLCSNMVSLSLLFYIYFASILHLFCFYLVFIWYLFGFCFVFVFDFAIEARQGVPSLAVSNN